MNTFRRWVISFLALILLPAKLAADERQYKLEAAFLYNFFNYITWPGYASPQQLSDPTICVYGRDPITDYLEYVRRKMADERSLNIRVIESGQNTEDCHIFFVRHRVPYQIADKLPKNTLTVLKPDDPLDRGGMIELAEEEERISIRINQEALSRNGFQTSSRLLELARVTR